MICWGPVGGAATVAYSPDGKRMAAADGSFYSQAIQIRDATSGKEVMTLRKQTAAAFQRAVIQRLYLLPMLGVRWGLRDVNEIVWYGSNGRTPGSLPSHGIRMDAKMGFA